MTIGVGVARLTGPPRLLFVVSHYRAVSTRYVPLGGWLSKALKQILVVAKATRSHTERLIINQRSLV